jgi:sugar phosphate isomerase/epimerase
MEIGVWTSFYNEMEVEDAVRHLAEVGWLHIEFSCEHITRATEKDWKNRLEALRELCQSLGVKAWQLHSPFELNVASFDPDKQRKSVETALQWIIYCQVLNVPYMVIHPGGSQGYRSLKEKQKILQLNVDSFKEMGKFAEDQGVKLAVENMLAGDKSGGRRFPGEHIVELHEIIAPWVPLPSASASTQATQTRST